MKEDFVMTEICDKFASHLTFEVSTMSGKEQIRELIMRFPKGTILFPEDFSFVGSARMISTSLIRLCNEKVIIRLGQGIYCYPKIDEKWGLGIITPSIEEIARAIAERDKARIAPTGSYALNKLGLSQQLQANVVFFTDGSPRRINIGKGNGILFKRTSQMKQFAYKSQLMQLIVSAMREIGKEQITETEIQIIREHLKNVSESDFNNDISLAPEWVQKTLKSII